MKTVVLCALCVLCGSTFLGGCGYSLAGRGTFLPPHIRTIGIPTFTNRTTVFNIETLLTDKVRSEFIGRGKYTILPQGTGVDALLAGEITTVALVPVSFAQTQQASRYTLTMVARIEFRDMESNTVIWDNPSLSFRQDYEAAGGANATDPNAFFNQQANALDRVATDFARTIVSAILEAF
jgi:hypothetical protein